MIERYSRQIIFKGIGEEGQNILLNSRVAIIGVGALGTVIANNLARAGVGFIRLIDRDFVDITNLQRQTLYTEDDVKEIIPKAIAAARHLSAVNSEITLEPLAIDVNAKTIISLIEDVDLVLDGTDNFETRLIINEACCKYKKPWIYGGALGSDGATMNIIPGKTPCLRCLYPNTSSLGSHETCSSAGVLNMITGVIGCFESAEALKILTNSPQINSSILYLNIWNNTIDYVEINKNPECPVCVHGQYEWLKNFSGSHTTSLCGRDSIQIVPAIATQIDFAALASKLNKLGEVSYSAYILHFLKGNIEITVFTDGRAIIKNALNEDAAKSIYAEYIGL